MGRITIYNDVYANSTAVSNCFIDTYMKDANDAQLKVYLYLLRILGSGMSTSVSDIADKFNHTEKDVLRALQYWEKMNLLSLDYDSDKSLSGIHLFDMNSTRPAEAPVQDQHASVNRPIAPVVSITSRTTVVPKSENTSVTAKDPYVKPDYTLDQLKDFKNRQDTAQLLFITEQYLGKTLTPTEIKTIFFMHDQLHFSEDLIDFLLQYCVGRGKKDFRYIEKVAVNWAMAGVTTPKEAEQFTYKYDKTVYSIMNALGKNSAPTNREVDYINRWTREYAFTEDIILEACARTVLATDKHRFEYAEGILSSWRQANVHSPKDIAQLDAVYQKKKAVQPKTVTTNKFNQFTQNSYDFDELEHEILSN